MLMTVVAGHLASNTYATLVALQAQDSINSGNSKLLMFFVGIAAIALLAQAVVVVALGFVAYKLQKVVMGHVGTVMTHVNDIKTKTLPIIDKAHILVTDLTPKINDITAKVNVIAGQVEQIVTMAKDKAEEFSPTISKANETARAATETAAEANLKTRAQIKRVDGMISTALDATARLGAAIEKGITTPGKEVAGIISGLRVGLTTLIDGARAFGSGSPVGKTYTAPRPPRSVAPYRAAEPYPSHTESDLDL